MLLWFIGIVVSLVVLWAGYTQFYEGALGQPVYSVISTFNDIEIRRYEPFVIASTQLGEPGDSELSSGFRVLAGYIFGGNNPGEKLAMTAPVLQQNSPGESIPMTAPVLRSAEGMRMAFVMPAGRNISDLPLPKSAKVSLTNVDWGEAIAIRFSGRGKQNRFERAETKLRAALIKAGRSPAGPALYAQYNSPSAFPPLRRNEVIIPIAPK
jgi:hypothetical protein